MFPPPVGDLADRRLFPMLIPAPTNPPVHELKMFAIPLIPDYV